MLGFQWRNRPGRRRGAPGTFNILDNTVRISGSLTAGSYGIGTFGGAGGLIARNDVRRLTAATNDIGIRVSSPNGTVVDSNVVDVGLSAGARGSAGIALNGSGSATITNNTVRFGSSTGPASFGIGDNTSFNGIATIAYTIENNIVWSAQNSGSTNCIQITSTSSVTTLANNDLFSCSTGLVDVGSSNGAGGFELTTAGAVAALSNASGNVNTTIIGAGYFVNDASNWRFQEGQLSTAEFETLKEGGLVLTSSGARDIDGNLRPAGTVGSTGWSMGAYQQNY